jgi:hypothetical protein
MSHLSRSLNLQCPTHPVQMHTKQSIASTICDPHKHDRIRELQCPLKDCSPEVLRLTAFLHHPNLIANRWSNVQSQAFIQHNIGILGLTAPQANTVAALLSLLLVERSLFIYNPHYKLSNSHGISPKSSARRHSCWGFQPSRRMEDSTSLRRGGRVGRPRRADVAQD